MPRELYLDPGETFEPPAEIDPRAMRMLSFIPLAHQIIKKHTSKQAEQRRLLFVNDRCNPVSVFVIDDEKNVKRVYDIGTIAEVLLSTNEGHHQWMINCQRGANEPSLLWTEVEDPMNPPDAVGTMKFVRVLAYLYRMVTGKTLVVIDCRDDETTFTMDVRLKKPEGYMRPKEKLNKGIWWLNRNKPVNLVMPQRSEKEEKEQPIFIERTPPPRRMSVPVAKPRRKSFNVIVEEDPLPIDDFMLPDSLKVPLVMAHDSMGRRTAWKPPKRLPAIGKESSVEREAVKEPPRPRHIMRHRGPPPEPVPYPRAPMATAATQTNFRSSETPRTPYVEEDLPSSLAATPAVVAAYSSPVVARNPYLRMSC